MIHRPLSSCASDPNAKKHKQTICYFIMALCLLSNCLTLPRLGPIPRGVDFSDTFYEFFISSRGFLLPAGTLTPLLIVRHLTEDTGAALEEHTTRWTNKLIIAIDIAFVVHLHCFRNFIELLLQYKDARDMLRFIPMTTWMFWILIIINKFTRR